MNCLGLVCYNSPTFLVKLLLKPHVFQFTEKVALKQRSKWNLLSYLTSWSRLLILNLWTSRKVYGAKIRLTDWLVWFQKKPQRLHSAYLFDVAVWKGNANAHSEFAGRFDTGLKLRSKLQTNIWILVLTCLSNASHWGTCWMNHA